jgi:hypothetical protein
VSNATSARPAAETNGAAERISCPDRQRDSPGWLMTSPVPGPWWWLRPVWFT